MKGNNRIRYVGTGEILKVEGLKFKILKVKVRVMNPGYIRW